MNESMKKIDATSIPPAGQPRQAQQAKSGAIEHAQQALDEALRESFPASDPVAVSIAKPVAIAKPVHTKAHNKPD